MTLGAPLHATADWHVINKPAGLASCMHSPKRQRRVEGEAPAALPMEGAPRAPVIDSVEAQRPDWYAAHRLDNDTSGCLLLARDAATLAHFRAQFDAHTIAKDYLAIVHGVTPTTATITHAIGHHPTNQKRMVIAHAGQAIRGTLQTAHSDVTTLAQTPLHPQLGPLSLVRVRITTGVRHQIRVHLASLGHPIVGDVIYGKQRAPGIAHHLLHAWQLGFDDPATGERITVVAPVPERLQTLFPGITPV